MAISYSSPLGTHIESFAMDETCIDQTDQVGNNTVVVSDDIVAAGNGQIGTKIIDYTGRLVVLNLGGTEQQRMCVDSEAIGTPTVANSWLLTMDRDWDTNPLETTDSIYVVYDVDDIETGGESGGINLNSKTGLYELTNDLTIDSGGGLQNSFGVALEFDDNGNSPNTIVSSGGHFYSGFLGTNNTPAAGGIFTSYNNSAGEPNIEIQNGGEIICYDALFWAQLVTQDFQMQSTAVGIFHGCKWLSNSRQLTLFSATIKDCSVQGNSTSVDIIEIDDDGDIDGFIVIDMYRMVWPTGTGTITVKNATFIKSTGINVYVGPAASQDWLMINPVWDAVDYNSFAPWPSSTSNSIIDARSVETTVQESDGTKLQDALVIVYEGLTLDDLVVEAVTDVNGYVYDYWTYLLHETDSSTTTYGDHALRVDKWLYIPFISALVTTEQFEGTVTLIDDPSIVETTQATALTAGSGTTWNEDTNPSEIFEFTAGSGTLADGMIITFDTGAVGTITGLQDGDSTAGTIHLKDRNSTAIANGDDFSRTGGTAGTFSGTYTNDSKQPFSIWIDGDDLSMQITYDYLAALTSETTLSATGELIHEWGRDSQARALYNIAAEFSTERSYSKGIFITNFGAGSISHFTDDAGNTWVPPTSTTVTFTGMKDNSEVRVYLTGTNEEVAGIEDATAGTTDDRSFAWAATATTVVDYVIHNFQPGDEIYQSIRVEGYVVPGSNTSIAIQQVIDRNVEN